MQTERAEAALLAHARQAIVESAVADAALAAMPRRAFDVTVRSRAALLSSAASLGPVALGWRKG